MTESRLPAEVELAYEVMSCQAMRLAQEPSGTPHPCSYFRRWGTYHSYDYTIEGAPKERGVVHRARYVGRAPLVPELLSGCRKAPIMAVGINPNLPGWWANRRRSLNPLFDDYRQYAHYFRYRATEKVQLSEDDYQAFGGGDQDTPFTDFELEVPADEDGQRQITLHPQPQSMYVAYQGLLDDLAREMGWEAQLTLGEDLSYGNMVASPSARWTTRPLSDDPEVPPMTREEHDGIISECFRDRRYFLRQLMQSLPAVILVFSQVTANALIGELGARFTQGSPEPEEPLSSLAGRDFRLGFGEAGGRSIDARVIFSPHITGNRDQFAAQRRRVLAQLIEEARAERLRLNPATGHLQRSQGACVFCPMLEIGPCDYVDELEPLSPAPRLTADSAVADLQVEKDLQSQMVNEALAAAKPVELAWAGTDQDSDWEKDRP